uniref:Uncharacterized protein n=1 Tax=Anguilla anguilla TaxID=7936 RepID=A0A0E9SBI4_ANGAN
MQKPRMKKYTLTQWLSDSGLGDRLREPLL